MGLTLDQYQDSGFADAVLQDAWELITTDPTKPRKEPSRKAPKPLPPIEVSIPEGSKLHGQQSKS